MRKTTIVILLLSGVFLFQFCSSSRKTAAVTPRAITYESHILPVVQTSCAPCHIAGKGKKKPLDNYADAHALVDDMITRMQKNPGEKGFMPAMHPKLPDSTIAVFIAWKGAGLQEK